MDFFAKIIHPLYWNIRFLGKGLDKLIDSLSKEKQAIGLNNKLYIVSRGDQRYVIGQRVNELGL